MKALKQIKDLATATDNAYLLNLTIKLEKEIKKEIQDTRIKTAYACIDFGF